MKEKNRRKIARELQLPAGLADNEVSTVHAHDPTRDHHCGRASCELGAIPNDCINYSQLLYIKFTILYMPQTV